MVIRFLAVTLSLTLSSAGTATPPEKPAATSSLEAQLLKEPPAALGRAAREKGNPIQGALLFHQPHMTCLKCHACGTKTSPLGPDLARPEKDVTDASLVESVLAPSKVLRKGYDTVHVTRANGTTVTGLLVEDRKDAIVLLDPAREGQKVTIARKDVEELSRSPTSIMPAGLVNLLADRQQFLDLVSYLIEIAEHGPARARSLRPDPAVLNPPLPAYESHLDHAGMIAGFDRPAFERGKRLHHLLCASCHGTPDQVGSMPTSLPFASGAFRNGSDPYALYQTLTRGYGMMPPQSTLVPQQKYDVIHFLREAYLKPSNPSQYARVDGTYLARLPKGTSRGPRPAEAEPWLRADYGPTLIGTYEIGSSGNIAYKGIAVRLDRGDGGIARGRAWVVFEHDTLRIAGGWTGRGFIDWNGIHFNGKHEVHPRAVGQVQFETKPGPGWADPETGRFDDPRLRGRDGRAYGPLPRAWGHYHGLYHAGNRVVISYSVGDTAVLESPGLAGSEDAPVFTRTFHIGPRTRAMTLQVSRSLDLAKGLVNAPPGMAWVTEGQEQRLRIPAGPEAIRFTLWLARGLTDQQALQAVAADRPVEDLTTLTRGGPPRWTTTLTTRGELGRDDGPFAVDTLPVPRANPWRCQVRPSGLDFLPDGKQALVCTWDGDVWRVGGLDRPAAGLTWRRIASGLFQPLGLKVADGKVYVGCRDQIVILHDRNGDGETDFCENFNSDHQVTESFHEFAMGLQTDAEGNFYYCKGARHGKTAIVPHHGTLLRVDREGRRTDILATGFRAPNGVCVNPDGTFFVTDQEGHWNPKNRINWVRPGRFYGNLWGYTDVTDPSDTAMDPPLCWITNRFDRSPSELVRVASPSWGPLNGSLLNFSYGYGKVYVAPYEKVGDVAQGGMSVLPLPQFPTGVMRGRFHPGDGHLYACGMYSWAGSRHEPGGLFRIRATGKPAYQPIGFQARAGKLVLTLSDPLDPQSASDAGNFGMKVWSLKRSANYGSPHLHERALKVSSTRLSTDRRTVVLEVPELQPTWCLELWYSLLGADGKEVDGLFHGTIHRLPE